MNHDNSSLTEFDKMVLTEYPYPIAVGYRRVLRARDWRTKVDFALTLFEFGLRTVTMGLISQYRIRDLGQVNDVGLNAILQDRLPRASLGDWNNMFFTILRAYRDRRDLFFMKELYDIYWDTSVAPHRSRRNIEEIQAPYNWLIETRNKLFHRRLLPESDNEWQALWDEVLPRLHEVLSHFAFVASYNLLRITKKISEDEYQGVLYTGEQPKVLHDRIRSTAELQPGWLYLSKDYESFLQLYPLLVFWEDLETETTHKKLGDAALYDGHTRKTVHYNATVGRHSFDNPELAQLFIQLFDKFEELRSAGKGSSRGLTWHLLREASDWVTKHRFAEVKGKYRQELYLQREEARRNFERFLHSDKTIFLLLGKSGVGKSSFFVSLAEESGSNGEMCVFMYNGANVDATRPLVETIGQDFKYAIEDLSEAVSQDFLREAGRIPGIVGRRVVLFIDAVNENSNGGDLLTKINELADIYGEHKWFKIVLSSRPEAWRTLRRSSKTQLSERHYFSLPDQQEPGIELQPFSYGAEQTPSHGIDPLAVAMKSFTFDELSEVYKRYREVYKLQTPYEEVSSDLRRVLIDPLALWLISEIFEGKALPKRFQPGEIYPQYINKLVKYEKLRLEDIDFLEEELAPLIISEGHYENKITTEQVRTKHIRSVRLFELIHNSGRLSSTEQVNQSFQNLVDTEILVMQGSATDYEIVFRYERFYDYFGGKQLNRLTQAHPDRYRFYLDMIRMTGKQATTLEVQRS